MNTPPEFRERTHVCEWVPLPEFGEGLGWGIYFPDIS